MTFDEMLAQVQELLQREQRVSYRGLKRRWDQAKAGDGQVVLLSGEPGIGKSRLVQELKEQLGDEEAARIEFRCSPYHRSSALYPVIAHLQRFLQFAREDSPAVKLEKLQHTLSRYRFPQVDTPSLLAAVLSLPHPAGYPLLTLSPQQQKEKTQAALVAWLVEEAEQAAVFCVWEDLHWADPSTLEVLTLLLDQVPTTQLLVVLTFRPEFPPPWGNRSHLSHLTLSRLGRAQVKMMVTRVTGEKSLPPEVVQQIVAKTDGVPLFVEELTKTVVESGLLRAEGNRYVRAHGGSIPPLAIPATLQDSLMARLDRLSTARELAQLGATIGREFNYELLQAVSLLNEATLQHGLKQLVEVELLYQRGLPPHATYLFKHALIQDTAYESLLKSKRQQYHQQIATVLEAQFPDTTETQPELVAHHYTEAGLIAQAIPYWQRAGERTAQRSANVEAIAHLTTALELLKALPDTPARAQQELSVQTTLGPVLIAAKGYAAPEVERAYARARELCQQGGEASQIFSALCRILGEAVWCLGEFPTAQQHFEAGIALYDPQQHHSLTALYGGEDPGVFCHGMVSSALWLCGYPDRALKRIEAALTLARELAHPFNLAYALMWAAWFHQYRHEGQAVQELAEEGATLATEHGFPYWLACSTILRGWALTEQGQGEEGVAQLRQGLAVYRATGVEEVRSYFLALLAEACGKAGQTEEGLSSLAEALAFVHDTGERFHEAELYRLKGELTLQKFQASGSKFPVPHPQHPTPNPQAEAEEYFLNAIAIARGQQAKSLELRAVMSLSRLWQQGKKEESRQMLAEIYGRFTEGFDTKDLQEAKTLLAELHYRRQ